METTRLVHIAVMSSGAMIVCRVLMFMAACNGWLVSARAPLPSHPWFLA
ncbi:hypothetical protein I5E68_06465 [Novosphingobium sp. YJ-S2-02]|uniref:Uncharacterized protein n=1 Tax=Novosphingobium aureum TaxID=2792964 RepID=A0A931HBV5_9SPHN|nr:hypothetical protein [Novosphingobium aureum]MBH0112596.1 hypothetical protein [Novosphingobium aureum]